MCKGTMKVIAALVGSMFVGLTAHAAPSPEASTVVGNVPVYAKDADGNEIEGLMITSEIPEQYIEAENQIKSQTGFAEIVEALQLKELIGAKSTDDIVLIDLKDVSVPEHTKFPVTISFEVQGVTEKTRGVILHYNKTQWETVPTTMGEGTMTGVFESLSPVAFVIDRTTVEPASNDEESTVSKTDGENPKTGETSHIGIIAALLFSGAVVVFMGIQQMRKWKKKQ